MKNVPAKNPEGPRARRLAQRRERAADRVHARRQRRIDLGRPVARQGRGRSAARARRRSSPGSAPTPTPARMNAHGRQPARAMIWPNIGRKTSAPVALPAAKSPSTTPRRASNQRVAIVVPNISAIEPAPTPTAAPQIGSCQAACTNVDADLGAGEQAQRRHDRAAHAEALHRRRRERSGQAEQRDLDPDRDRDRARVPAELGLHRLDEHRRRRQDPRRRDQRQERRGDDDPGIVDAGLHTRYHTPMESRREVRTVLWRSTLLYTVMKARMRQRPR